MPIVLLRLVVVGITVTITIAAASAAIDERSSAGCARYRSE